MIDSRPALEGRVLRRRRKCVLCERRFTTMEIPVEEAVRFTLEIDLKGTFDARGGELRVKLQEDNDGGPA